MILYVFLAFVIMSGPARADIFTANNHNPDEEMFQRAMAQDMRGFYYRPLLDNDFTSQFHNPFEYESNDVRRKASQRIDLHKTMTRQIPKVLSGYELSMPSLMASVNSSPLMLYQYSSPAAADLFKFYYTAAQLKLAMFYADLKGLEGALQGDWDAVRDQAQLACVQAKLNRGEFEKDIVDLMESCRDSDRSASGPLYYLNTGEGSNILERALNRLHARGQEKANALEIMPAIRVGQDNFRVIGPDKRIGQVLSESRQAFMEQIDAVLAQYLQEKSVSEAALRNLSLPGVPFTQANARDLLVLPMEQRQLALRHLAGQLAFVQTQDRYGRAIEWLQRALMYPDLEVSYGGMVRQALAFLKSEKVSLEDKQGHMSKYAAAMGSLLDASQAERFKAIAHQDEDGRRRSDRANIMRVNYE